METEMSGRVAALVLCGVSSIVLGACGDGTSTAKPKDFAIAVMATVETVPMQDAEDAADDPAIWVDTDNPANSVIIGTNKQRGLGVYTLDGKLLSFRNEGRLNNVDLRQNVNIGGMMIDIIAATNRTNQTIALYVMDPTTRSLMPLAPIASGLGDPYGVCLYHSKTGEVYVIANDSGSGNYVQWRLFSPDGTEVKSQKVRNFTAGSQAEGCVADDANGKLFISEEDIGIWAYGAEPTDGDARTGVDTVAAGHLTADSEGISLVDEGNGAGYVIASSQGSNSYTVYDRKAPYAFKGAFVVGDGAIDGVAETDGLDVTAANLGPAFPGGVFIAQDGFNTDGQAKTAANQNFKLVPWPELRDALKLPAPLTQVP
jgi:3-phytase